MNDVIIKDNIENLIYEIRGKQVMLDSDLAKLYNVETGALNRQVKRNIKRFPKEFCFQLTKKEYENLKCQIGISSLENKYGGRRTLPYAFTEQGVAMLSGILHTDAAINTSIMIIDAFVAMKKYISTNLLEQEYINNLVLEDHDKIKLLEKSFDKLSEKRKANEIYFSGQIYDAYSKIIDIFNEAKEELIIIDAYADKKILDIIKRMNTKVIIITKKNNLLTNQDIKIYNEQYNNLKVIYDNTFHDRYFIIDNKTVYHCGTSINRIGHKTFSINLLDDEEVSKSIIKNITKLKKEVNK